MRLQRSATGRLLVPAWVPQPNAAGSTVVSGAASIANDGVASCSVTITLVDSLGNPVAGVTPALSVSGTGNTVTQPGPTSASGVATGSFVSTGAEAKTISVRGVAQTASCTVSAGVVSPVFMDTFASGDFTHAENGYGWSGSEGSAGATVSVIPDPTGAGYGYVMELTFPGTGAGTYSRAQMDYHFGAYLTAVWEEMMMYIPGPSDGAWSAAYVERTNGSGTNNKLGYVWHDAYTSSDILMGNETELYPPTGGQYPRPVSTTSTGGADVPYNASKPAYTNCYDSGCPRLIDPNGVMKPGAWYRLRLLYQPSSSVGALDGAMEMWVATGPNFTDNQLVYSFTGRDFSGVAGSAQTLKNGYLMGEANSGFDANTTFLITNVKIYTINPGW